ncbi:MAG: nucleoside 2-deoxyribosyltransferase [bacterium]
MKSLPRAYLAGPDVFYPEAKAMGKAKCDLLLTHGIIGHFPLDNEVPVSPEIAHEIFLGNVQLIDRSDIILANIVPFRGPSLDPGTAWEIGYAYAKGIPVICYGSRTTYLERCRVLGLEGSTKGVDQAGMIIEDFGEQENLMITRCASLIVDSFEEAVVEAQRLVS